MYAESVDLESIALNTAVLNGHSARRTILVRRARKFQDGVSLLQGHFSFQFPEIPGLLQELILNKVNMIQLIQVRR
jgi:hypothetical protein